MLEFGTTVLAAADGSIAGLLGASPGASTAVPAMLDVMERCFPDRYHVWQPKLKEMVPSLGVELSDEPRLFEEVWAWGTKVLKLDRHCQPPRVPMTAAMTVALRRSWAKDLDAADALRVAQAAGRGVRRRAGHAVSRAGRARPARRDPPLLAGRPDGEVISTLRLMEEHPGGEKAFRIGRVCTKRNARGHGHTTRLLQAALAEVGDYPCRINAQTYLEEMYAKHGFVRDGDEFLDDGIPHVPMVKHGPVHARGVPRA